jgi:hypothetical protein
MASAAHSANDKAEPTTLYTNATPTVILVTAIAHAPRRLRNRTSSRFEPLQRCAAD